MMPFVSSLGREERSGRMKVDEERMKRGESRNEKRERTEGKAKKEKDIVLVHIDAASRAQPRAF